MRAARRGHGVRAAPDRQRRRRRPERGRLQLRDDRHDRDDHHDGRHSHRRPPLLGSFAHHRPLADPGGAAVAHAVHAGRSGPAQRDGPAHPGLRAHPGRRHPPPAAAGQCPGPAARAPPPRWTAAPPRPGRPGAGPLGPFRPRGPAGARASRGRESREAKLSCWEEWGGGGGAGSERRRHKMAAALGAGPPDPWAFVPLPRLQVAMATGQVLFHRFFYSKSFVKHSFEVSRAGAGGRGFLHPEMGSGGGGIGSAARYPEREWLV